MLPTDFDPWRTICCGCGALCDCCRTARSTFLVVVVVVEIAGHLDGEPGFEVPPRRWVIERTFGRLIRWRRLVRDFEQRLDPSEAMIQAAMGSPLLRRLAHRRPVSNGLSGVAPVHSQRRENSTMVVSGNENWRVARPPTPVSPPSYVRTVVAGTLGNALEAFDFAVYSIFTEYIAKTFYPSQSAFVGLLLTVATFGIGFVARPIGAAVLGAYADRAGRKAALTLTILLMGLGTGVIGCLPGHDSIGIAAPVLLVVARLIQGFAAGGEIGSSIALMMEASPDRKRGTTVAWQVASQPLALIASGLIGFSLTHFLPLEALQAWGWRIPFLLGVAIVPVGVYIRNNLDETLPEETRYHSSGELFHHLLRGQKFALCMCTLIIGGIAVNQYFLSYMTTYALTALKLPAEIAMLAPLASGITGVVFALSGGYIVDRFGPLVINIVPRILLILIAYPVLSYVVMHPAAPVFLLAIVCLAALNLICYSTAALVAAECFPRELRGTGYSLGYAVGVTLFGGTGQIVYTWLIHYTGNALSPAFYVIFGTALTMFATLGAIRHQRSAQPTSGR